MYTQAGGRDIKYSWPLSEAIGDAIGDELDVMLRDAYVTLTKDQVEAVITSIYMLFTGGIKDIVSPSGMLSGQYFLKVGNLGNVASALLDWLMQAEDADTLSFG
jgi:hypothetical protein